jgi:hypothetical protein
LLAARIAISNLQKQTKTSFSETMSDEHNHVNSKTGLRSQLISEEFMETIKKHGKEFDAAIDYKRDFDFDYFGKKHIFFPAKFEKRK